MKPENWDKMSRVEKERFAVELLYSMRGSYIIGQALYVASTRMAMAPFPEQSNIEDMEVLATHPRFAMGWAVTKDMSELRKEQENARREDRTGEG